MAKKSNQQALFDPGEWWDELWDGMPEFKHEDQTSFKAIIVHFATPEDYAAFSKLIGQRLLEDTRSIWYPPAEIGRYSDKVYATESRNEP